MEMEHKSAYKYIEFGILVLGIVLVLNFILGSNGNSLQNKTASAFEWEKEINIYFANSKMGSNEDCSKVLAVKRIVPNAEILGPAATSVLLKGPTLEEAKAGYFSVINNNVIIQKFELKGTTAYVDFNQRFSETGGSCAVTAIRSQITKTLTNLPGVKNVVISVNSQTEGILEP